MPKIPRIAGFVFYAFGAVNPNRDPLLSDLYKTGF